MSLKSGIWFEPVRRTEEDYFSCEIETFILCGGPWVGGKRNYGTIKMSGKPPPRWFPRLPRTRSTNCA